MLLLLCLLFFIFFIQVLTLEQIQQLVGTVSEKLLAQQKLKPKVMDTLEQSRKNIQKSVAQTTTDQSVLHTL